MKPPKDMTEEELEVNINTERPYAEDAIDRLATSLSRIAIWDYELSRRRSKHSPTSLRPPPTPPPGGAK